MRKKFIPTSNNRRFRIYLRSSLGAYLLEMLVALFVSGVMAAALMTGIVEGMRSTTGSQNQVIATWLAHEAMERVRRSAAQANPSLKLHTVSCVLDVPPNTEVQFKVKSTDGVTVAPYDFLQHPLLLDLDALKWINKSGTDETPTTFDGIVKAKFGDIANGGKNVQINISWKESATGEKTYSTKGVVYPPSNYQRWTP